MNAIANLSSVVSATARLVLAAGFMASACWTQAQHPGAFDPSFQASLGGPPDEVLAMVKQTNGQIIVSAFSFIGGYYRFSNINGVPRDGIARLNADGSLDTAFNPSLDSEVDALAVQVDGMLVIGGGFSQVNGIRRNGLARLHADGTLDTSFVTFLPAYVQIRALAIQSDGKVLAAAEYLTQDWNVLRVLRFLPDGNFDPDFAAWPMGSDRPEVNAIVVQPDGRILLGGQFQSVGTLARDGLA
ncbi:MAG: delta-60 repeat domain-containing protein, partial [bacterium]